MNKAVVTAGLMLLVGAIPANAHRLDEYLEATTIEVSRAQLRLDIRLAPGVAVASSVLDSVDTNRDGAISKAEEQDYGRRVQHDVSVTLDGEAVPLRLVSQRFDGVDEIRHGVGEMQLAFEAELPPGGAHHHRLAFQNTHRSAIAAYLVNSLVPSDRDIHIVSQRRNYRQSMYELRYDQDGAGAASVTFGTLGSWAFVLGVLLVVLGSKVASFLRRRAALSS